MSANSHSDQGQWKSEPVHGRAPEKSDLKLEQK
jgi:hypothetical protein